MASYKVNFEKEIRSKLSQKSTAHQSEEAVLQKNFKFFDLDNSGHVSFDEFVKAIEKIGVQVFSKDQLRDLFNLYDTSGDGNLDYREFSHLIFSGGLPTSAQKQGTRQASQEEIDALIEKIRTTLAKRGPGGIIGLGKQFRIADNNNSRDLDKDEFLYAMRDFGTGLTDREVTTIFNYFDRDQSGHIHYDEFLLGVRGKMNNFRRALVNQAFEVIDADHSGALTIADLRDRYNAKSHPDVKAGKKTEDQVLTEFLHTFESMYDYHRINDDKVTRDEFIEYYNFISASIDNDQYFELMMNNTWRINEGANKNWNKQGWANRDETTNPPTRSNPILGGRVKEERKTDDTRKTGRASVGSIDISAVLEKIRGKLNLRGAKGYIGMQRQFKIMDDDNDKAINYKEFSKAVKDFKFDLTEEETRALFKEFDVDGSGHLSIDEFVRGVRGEMSPARVSLVKLAFKALDKDGDGILRINDIKGVYSARNHPDIKSGKKSEDEVLGEFLETFETHHNLRAGSRDQNVTIDEFVEYYNNISANIDNDKYFEHMIVTSYKLYNVYPQFKEYIPPNEGQKSWTGDFKSAQKNVRSTAPFGTSDEPTSYTTTSRPQTANPGGRQTSTQQGPILSNVTRTAEELIEVFRKKILARGARGIFGLSRLFKIIDDDGSRKLNYPEFTKCIKDFRLEFKEEEVKKVFGSFDRNKDGELDYDEFLRAIRGPIAPVRQKLVKQAFNKLDRDGSGVVNLDDIRGVYNAKNHPDVRAGKRTEDEVLAEFLDTFEQHHAVSTGDFKLRDANVSWEEFLEYYNNISCSIDDDKYFDLMIRNAWNLDNVSYQKGWRGEY